jgi:hypothetical protein
MEEAERTSSRPKESGSDGNPKRSATGLSGLPPGLSPELLEAYEYALRIKAAQGIEDPLELNLILGSPPRVRLVMGDLILSESETSYRELIAIFRGRQGLGKKLRQITNFFTDSENSFVAMRGRLARRVQNLRLEPKASPTAYLAALAMLSLAALPSYFVYRDRWQDAEPQLEIFRTLWTAWPFSEKLNLPPYFAAVLLALLVLLIVVAAVRSPEKLSETELFLAEPMEAKPAGAEHKVTDKQRRRGGLLLGLSLLAAIGLAVRATVFEGNLGFNWAFAFLGVYLGLFLLETPLAGLKTLIRERGGKWTAMLLAHLALLGLLANIYAGWGNIWIGAPLFVLAWANLLTYRKNIHPIYWVVTSAIVVYSLAINAWWFAVIGDEFSFFRDSAYIARQNTLQIINELLFRGNYVYGSHPFISSLLHSFFIKAFGENNFAWRFSSLYYSAIAVGFFFLFFRTFLHKNYALLASIFIAASHYVMSFGKIGYNNLQALLALSIVLAATGWAVRSRSTIAFFTLGVAQAFCFYVYPAALYVVPIPYLLLLLYHPPRNPRVARDWAASLAGLLLLTFPLFLQPDYWASKVAGTVAFNPELVSDSLNTAAHFTTNIVYSLLSPLYIVDESHFVAVGYTDLILAGLVFLGLALMLTRFWRHRLLVFFLLTFLYLLFIIGTTHDRVYPPNTRMFLLLPFFAFLATYALAWAGTRLKSFGVSERRLGNLAVVLSLGILALNIYQAYPLSYRRMTRYHNFEVFFLNIADNYFSQATGEEKALVVVHDPDFVFLPSLTELLDIYQVPYQEEQILGIPAWPPTDGLVQAALDSENSLVIVDLRLPDETRIAATELLRTDLEKLDCPVRTVLRDMRFNLWYSTDYAWTCPIP